MYIFGPTWKLRREEISIYRSCPCWVLLSGWVFRSTATSWLSFGLNMFDMSKNQKSLLTLGACWEAQENVLILLKLLAARLDASFGLVWLTAVFMFVTLLIIINDFMAVFNRIWFPLRKWLSILFSWYLSWNLCLFNPNSSRLSAPLFKLSIFSIF